jgi:hypothetical protein
MYCKKLSVMLVMFSDILRAVSPPFCRIKAGVANIRMKNRPTNNTAVAIVTRRIVERSRTIDATVMSSMKSEVRPVLRTANMRASSTELTLAKVQGRRARTLEYGQKARKYAEQASASVLPYRNIPSDSFSYEI